MDSQIIDKSGRIIVRNLIFTIQEKHLKKLFQQYGKILEINLPINNESNKNKGYAFIQYSSKEEALKAIENLNGKTYKGRIIAIDFSIPKGIYQKYENENKLKENNQEKDNEVSDQSKDIVDLENDDENEYSSDNPSINQESEKEAKLMIVSKKNSKIDDKIKDHDKEPNLKDMRQEKINQGKNISDDYSKKKKVQKNSLDKERTVFIRNIGFDITENEFKEYFETFGEIEYAKLCKDFSATTTHKGTGFVKFKNPEDAKKILDISKKTEEYYASAQVFKKHNRSPEQELELGFRRLIALPAVNRKEVATLKEKNKSLIDKRNTKNCSTGLTDAGSFKYYTVNSDDMEKRESILKVKRKNLQMNPNLHVSKTRLIIRNIPKMNYSETELKSFIKGTISDYINQSSGLQNQYKNKRIIKQVKIVKDKEKEDRNQGYAFVECAYEEIADFIIKQMNNIEIKQNKKLIIDYALEDIRKLQRRKERMDNWVKSQKESQAMKPTSKDKNKKKEKKSHISEKGKDEAASKNPRIDEVEDIKTLEDMCTQTKSRGRKQRIRRRIVKLKANIN